MTGSGSLADYVVEKAIGKGHFSVVHRAVRKSDHKRVALKKVQIFDMMDAKARDRCLKEVQLLQTLPPHPSIIAYLDAFIDSNELYIVFEWAEFGDLRRLLKRAQETNTQLQEPQVWRYFIQVCAGVSHMHNARVMHRDIKPANIFLAAGGCVKLGDLGLGRAFSSQTYEALSKVGTPLYMSPEVLDGRGYEWKSDVWSLGCLLYELACLRSPFKAAGDSLYTLFKKISAGEYAALPSHFSSELSSLVASMIRIDPAKRPDVKATLDAATAALAALEAAGVGAPHDAAAATDAADAADPSTRRPSRQPSASRQPASAASRQAAEESEMCALAMDAVLDKLKLLRYEEGLLRPRRLPPLARGYFVGARSGRCRRNSATSTNSSAGYWSAPRGRRRRSACGLHLPTLAPTATTRRRAPPPPRSSTSSGVRAARSALMLRWRRLGCAPPAATCAHSSTRSRTLRSRRRDSRGRRRSTETARTTA